jgi:hydrogenase maturation factor
MNLISSGSLLITVKEEYVDSIIKDLNDIKVKSYTIGKMSKRGEKFLINNDEIERPVTDELWKALELMDTIKNSNLS